MEGTSPRFFSWINHENGLPGRFPEHLRLNVDTGQRYRSNIRQVQAGILPSLGIKRNVDEPLDFFVWGDSHAMALGELLDSLAIEADLSGVIAGRPVTRPLLGVSRSENPKVLDWNDSVLRYIRANKIPNVILVSRWTFYILGNADRKMDGLISDEKSLRINPEEAGAAFKRGLERTLVELEKLGTKVWIVKQVPKQIRNPKYDVLRAAFLNQPLPLGVSKNIHQERQKIANSIIDVVANSHEQVRILDPAEYCFDELSRSKVWSNEGVYYRDDDHLSPLGADRLLRPMFEPVFRELKISTSHADANVKVLGQL